MSNQHIEMQKGYLYLKTFWYIF